MSASSRCESARRKTWGRDFRREPFRESLASATTLALVCVRFRNERHGAWRIDHGEYYETIGTSYLNLKGVVFCRKIADNAIRSLLDEYSGQPIQ